MNSSARVTKHRKNLWADPEGYEAYLRKERERNQKRRQKLKQKLEMDNEGSQQLRHSMKNYETHRKRNYRKRIKQQQSSQSTSTSSDDAKCVSEECDNCRDQTESGFLSLFNEGDLNRPAILRQWEKNHNGFLTIISRESDVNTLIASVNKQFPYYKQHCFIKKSQAAYFESSKINVVNSEVILQVDFAENYSLLSQDEIQRAYWSHQQTTLFTAVVWMSNNVSRSFVVATDELEHGKSTVWVCFHLIFNELRQENKDFL